MDKEANPNVVAFYERYFANQSPRGQRMPETREQFNYLGDLYEKALIEKDKEISRLRIRINKLEQKLGK